MQTDILNQLENLSSESRKKLNGQIKRVQREASRLRAQACRLRRAQKPERSQGVFQQITRSLSGRRQGILKRSRDLASSGTSMAGSGQRLVIGRGGNLAHALGRRSNLASQSLADWRDSTAGNLRKQGQSLTQNASDWRYDTTYQLHKQRQRLSRSLSDLGEEIMHKLRRQGRHAARNLSDRREDAARKLRSQGRYVARNLADRREDAAHELRKQGRHIRRSRDEIAQRLRGQGQQFIDRGGELLERQRGNKVWPIVGFFAGFLLAGGATFWLIRRAFSHSRERGEERIELSSPENLNGIVSHPSGEIRYMSQGGVAVAARSRTSTEVTSKFVGVPSTHQYYPIERKPDAHDLVFFATEADARAEGYTAAL